MKDFPSEAGEGSHHPFVLIAFLNGKVDTFAAITVSTAIVRDDIPSCAINPRPTGAGEGVASGGCDAKAMGTLTRTGPQRPCGYTDGLAKIIAGKR